MIILDASTQISLFSTALSLSTTVSEDIDDNQFSPDPTSSSFKSPVATRAYIYRGGFCGRGNTIAGYNELNRHVSFQ